MNRLYPASDAQPSRRRQRSEMPSPLRRWCCVVAAHGSRRSRAAPASEPAQSQGLALSPLRLSYKFARCFSLRQPPHSALHSQDTAAFIDGTFGSLCTQPLDACHFDCNDSGQRHRQLLARLRRACRLEGVFSPCSVALSPPSCVASFINIDDRLADRAPSVTPLLTDTHATSKTTR